MDPTEALLLKTMKKLGTEDFGLFQWHLEKYEEIEESEVEGLNRPKTVNLLVRRFPQKALDVTRDILKQMQRNDLVELLSKDNSGAAGPSPGATAVKPTVDGEHFVDKHKTQLIQRVSCIGPILDDLHDGKVLQQEGYERIMHLSPSHKQMREIYCGGLKAGDTAKDIFYRSLEKNEPLLVADLKGQK